MTLPTPVFDAPSLAEKIGLSKYLAKEDLDKLASPSHWTQDALWQQYKNFVFKIANRFGELYRLPKDDLIHEGFLGLLKAREKFDSGRGVRFLTYAGWWILKAIRESAHRTAFAVPIPGETHTIARRVDAEAHGSIRPEDLAKLNDLRSKRPNQVKNAMKVVETIAHPTSVHDKEIEDRSSLRLSDAEPLQARRPNMIALLQEILDPDEFFVLDRQIGLTQTTITPCDLIGEMIGVTRQRVSMIAKEAAEKVKKHFKNGEHLLGMDIVPEDDGRGPQVEHMIEDDV